jgi:hypothetical protein
MLFERVGAHRKSEQGRLDWFTRDSEYKISKPRTASRLLSPPTTAQRPNALEDAACKHHVTRAKKWILSRSEDKTTCTRPLAVSMTMLDPPSIMGSNILPDAVEM